MRILAIGEIILDIFNGEAEIGGAPLNFCAHSALLGAESALISAVGTDELAEKAMEKIKAFGVDASFIEKNSYPTGRCIVMLENGVPSYNVIAPAAYDFIEADAESAKEYSADVFAFGTLIQRNAKSREAVIKLLDKCMFPHIFCDINLRKGCYDRESCLVCLKNATILKISSEEEPLLHEFGFYKPSDSEYETVKNICNEFGNIKLLIYTKGENGSLVYSAKDDEIFCFKAKKADVVSTVGAGDSYSAAFLCEYFKSGNIAAAGEEGSKLSARVVACREAVPEH